MGKKEVKKLGIGFLLLFLIAVGVDITSMGDLRNGAITRDELGGDTHTVNLVLNAEGYLKDYAYELEIAPQHVTEQQSIEYFEQSVNIIDKDFAGEWEDVPIKEHYLDGLVEAEWMFSPSGYLSSDGKRLDQEIPDEGQIIIGYVTLRCGNYEQIYSFPFQLNPEKLPPEEQIKKALKAWFEEEQAVEGSAYLNLPQEIMGISLEWTEKREYLCMKILFLELACIVGIYVSQKKKKQSTIMEKKREAEFQYAELVGMLLVLLETGMTTRQAWGKIADQYSMKKKKILKREEYVYEAVLHMVQRFQGGENERSIYQHFTKEVDVLCYRRLVRILLGNLEKGNKDVCKYLREEAQLAYEQRVLLAKRLGEEASTRMLVPLMMMMTVVMGIIMIPAIISLSI